MFMRISSGENVLQFFDRFIDAFHWKRFQLTAVK